MCTHLLEAVRRFEEIKGMEENVRYLLWVKYLHIRLIVYPHFTDILTKLRDSK